MWGQRFPLIPPPTRFIRKSFVRKQESDLAFEQLLRDNLGPVAADDPSSLAAIVESPEDFNPSYDPLAVSLYHAMGNSYGNDLEEGELPVTQPVSPVSAHDNESSTGLKRGYSAVDTEDDNESTEVEDGGESPLLQFCFSDDDLSSDYGPSLHVV